MPVLWKRSSVKLGPTWQAVQLPFIALAFVFLLLEPNKTEAKKKGLRRWALTVLIIVLTFLT